MNALLERMDTAANATADDPVAGRDRESQRHDLIRAILRELPLADDEVLESLARGYDAADAGNRGEVDPWSPDLVRQYIREDGPEAWEAWRQERISAARAGLQALIVYVTKERP